MSWAADVMQIHQTAALYAHVIDRREWERLADVYAEESVYDSARGGRFVGLKEITQYLSSSSQPYIHTGSNVVVDLEPGADRATGVAKYLVIREGAIEAGDYTDVWVRTPRGWRIKNRTSTNRALAPLAGSVDTASRLGPAQR